MNALKQYNADMECIGEHDPIERLRFFLSFALVGQDWIDVEQFIDGVSQQLAEREKQIVMLREAVASVVNMDFNYYPKCYKALYATQDLSGLVLCDAVPFGKVVGQYVYKAKKQP